VSEDGKNQQDGGKIVAEVTTLLSVNRDNPGLATRHEMQQQQVPPPTMIMSSFHMDLSHAITSHGMCTSVRGRERLF